MTRTHARTDGSSALKLDFGTTAPHGATAASRRLHLAEPADKYRLLDLRRRRAQIQARHLLEMMEEDCRG